MGAEGVRDLRRRLDPFGRVDGQQPVDQLCQGFRHIGANLADRRGTLRQKCAQFAGGMVIGADVERGTACQQIE